MIKEQKLFIAATWGTKKEREEPFPLKLLITMQIG